MFSGNPKYLDDNLLSLTESELQKLLNEQQFLIYIDEEGILKELEETIINYQTNIYKGFKKENCVPPLRFQFVLDIIKIQEVSENLLFLFTKEIDAGLILAKNVIYCGVQLMLPNVEFQKSDLQIIPLISNLPVTCDISDLLHSPSLGLQCIQGVLMSKTTLVKYVRSSVCSCGSILCPRNKWQRYPENFKNICPNCLSKMDEDVFSTDTGDILICQMISPKTYYNWRRFQVLNVRIKDELCAAANYCIGEEYKITGKLNENFFDAMNISAAYNECVPVMNLFSTVFPESIMNLYNRISDDASNCPWSFVYALSSFLGSHIIPESSYLHLKMGLILSLATQKNDEPPCPVVAIGPDTLNTQHLLHAAGKLSERYVRHSIAHSYLGGAAKSGHQPDVIWLEAGQLILAAKGVCNLGDWSKFKKEQANYICQTIESGQIVLNKGELGKTNLIDFVPLKCAVWTYWCHITSSRSDQLQLKTLINVFGIPFLAEEKNEREVKKILLKNLKKGKGHCISTKCDPNKIPMNDLKEFIKLINTKQLGISEEASQLIRNYFVLSRSERPHCLPIGAIKTITSLAEAHARLALRNEVLYEDVVAILYLYEESISGLFGESMNPHPKSIWDEDEPKYMFMGKELHRFMDWLSEYISVGS